MITEKILIALTTDSDNRYERIFTHVSTIITLFTLQNIEFRAFRKISALHVLSRYLVGYE